MDLNKVQLLYGVIAQYFSVCLFVCLFVYLALYDFIQIRYMFIE